MIKNSLLYHILRSYYHSVLKFFKSIYVRFTIRKARKLQKAEEIRLKNKEVYNCVFLALDSSIWKCDPIYRTLQENKSFNPIIFVCPIVNSGRDNMIEKMDQCYNMFVSKGYNVIKSYDLRSDSYIDLRELSPDIIFYTNPYKGLIDDRYYVDKFLDKLSIYVPYYINCTNDYEMAYNEPMHNYCWRYYVESSIHKKMAEMYSYSKGENVIISGYPGIEDFIRKDYNPIDTWKSNDKKLKRIVWAPHQTIELSGSVNYSCFLQYADFMLELAEKYKNKIQFAFKPHPLLKRRLEQKWGKSKVDEYYCLWANMDNSMISDSDYHDLFLTSDALIHDCGSFTVEYLYLNKPVMRLMNNIDPRTMFGDFGISCINQHYLAYKKEEIEEFVVNVINSVDPMKEKRTQFIDTVLRSNMKLPSIEILNDILNSIRNCKVS